MTNRAVAVLKGEVVNDVVWFTPNKEGEETTVSGEVKNLDPGLHDFHINQYDDSTNRCISAGPHFNPFGMTHGGPNDFSRHVGDNVIQLPNVGDASAQKDYLRIEMGHYTDIVLYERNADGTRHCPECPKSFIYVHALKGHYVRVHMHQKRFKCPICANGFWSNSDLERHMPKHTGQKFICDTCGHSYTSKQRLTEHFRNPSSCWLEPTMLDFMKKVMFAPPADESQA